MAKPEAPSLHIDHCRGSSARWKHMEDQILGIYNRSFQGVMTHDMHKANQAYLVREFCDSDTNIFLLKEQKTIVGFTTYYPAPMWSQFTDQEMQELQLSQDAYCEMQDSTLQVGWTAIDPCYQGKGGWTLLMNTLDTHGSTTYSQMVRYVRTAHDYSQKVARRYERQILFSRDIPKTPLGTQVYFRAITLPVRK